MVHDMRILSACCLLVATFAPAAALAESPSFKTPSGNILCGYRDVDGTQAVRCDILERADPDPVLPMPADCDLDWGNMFVVGRSGAAGLECAGDLAADPASPVLGYGEVTKHFGITCMSDQAGLTCINEEGKGFTLSKKAQKLF
jgi:hypothetical protein